ncbi:tRNA (5-methylaminomethyl-2-thiouridine)(34)-methyltransferase MnmD [Tropicibacter naphthalenivorans]|uniref:tRNA 5-methylaminomethyl-2-thiouridine biosynthesis bifunctional protein MnmC n=1 Tax=Tropicibacter naphthalenivorans TaxID=441103 RepID=A0A0P1GJ36_9RHOB|nr:tRNA (5-methylaminomethyl-2-thiouridine)(34)-methyltransferase MnmD [Tropicibacter naphthalenivorans]CUH75503.1 tRNA 5-methylaminomethyl-2-thiouridine biosynthesis bifunctional protein MnmC [Tropicibacter naphthalenivorans]SMC44098.1 tRNA U34 5-methylaminomethyl-2-thiouridine-forming methyltransferase MnmC [Tropicibacter naphthalenivorans]
MTTSSLDWRGDIPVSTRFDDPYYSLEHGLNETKHVFLTGNALPERFSDGFHIAELGFGTGLNLLAALQLWRTSGQQGRLHFTTFEAFPLQGPEMIRAQAAFAEITDIAAELAPFWQQGARQFTLPDLHFEMIQGDARETLPEWQGKADAWFLDGFSPAKNPELWSPELLHAVGQHTTPNGTAATYTAAGHVRRALADAGFDVTRIPGFGRKRHMTTARKA